MKVKIYTVQEVADLLGLYKRTVINYEIRGVFPSAKRSPVNNWRQYTEKDIKRLKEILQRED